MKINEIITESLTVKTHGKPGKVRADVDATLPGVFVQRHLRNTDPYMQYRYGIAVAAARAIKNGDLQPEQYDQESAFAENLTQVMFTPEDEETIMLASKLMGVTPTRIADNASREPKGTQKSSPVAVKKKNKYGV
jgi:hypothetical protein